MKGNDQKGHRKLYILLLVIFAALFCFSAYKVSTQLLTEKKEKQAFDELTAQVHINRQAQRVQTAETPAPEAHASAAPGVVSTSQASGEQDDASRQTPQAPTAETPAPEAHASAAPEAASTPAPASAEPARGDDASPVVLTPEPTPTEVPPMLEVYEPLYQRNHDLFGWIMIEGTEVNFPVMHTPRSSEYYLHKAFDRTYSFSGVPFMEGTCFPGCGNYIIYGHHMKNGTMFAPIVQYAQTEYWQEHPLIYFDTLYELGTYEVVAAFYSRVFTADETDVFRYYLYTDLRDPDVFDEYMEQVRSAAIYDTGIDTAYGDQLITLSTCEYSAANGRFVVVARKTD